MLASQVDFEPGPAGEGLAAARRAIFLDWDIDVLGHGTCCQLHAQIGRSHHFGAVPLQKLGHQRRLVLIGGHEQRLGGQDVLLIARVDLGGRWRRQHLGVDLGGAQDGLRHALAMGGRNDDAGALAPCPSGAARAVQQGLGIHGQFGMDDEVEIGQVDAARSDVGGDADAGAAVPHGLERIGALGLGQFAREGDHVEAAIMEARRKVLHRFAGRGEDDGIGAFEPKQRVDDGVLALVRGHNHELVVNIGMLLARAGCRNAQRIVLEGLGQLGDGTRHGGREQQRAAILGSRSENELEVFAEAEVEHFVGFI